MSFKFLSKAVLNPKPFRGTPREQAPVGDDPVACLRAMDAELKRMPEVDELGPPILPCVKPWLELTLFDGDDRPVPGAPYSLSLPGGQSRTGTLDETGFLHIDDIEADASELTATVRVHVDEQGAVERYEITVHGRVAGEDEGNVEAGEEDEATAEIAEFLII